jgi:hypothetical protein
MDLQNISSYPYLYSSYLGVLIWRNSEVFVAWLWLFVDPLEGRSSQRPLSSTATDYSIVLSFPHITFGCALDSCVFEVENWVGGECKVMMMGGEFATPTAL